MCALQRRSVPFFQHEVVIVGQFFARLDVAQRFDVNAAVLIDRLTIGTARMIDEARGTAVERGIDHDLVIHGEQHRMRRMFVLLTVALVGFFVRDALAGVLHETGALGNAGEREHAAPMDRRSVNDESSSPDTR